MHFLIERKAALAQAVDHMHFPQRARAIQHRRVQFGDEIVERLPAVFSLGKLVIKHMLGKINMIGFAPLRHRAGGEIDDAVERRLNVGEGQEFFVEIFRKRRCRFRRAFADQQARHMFRAGVGFGDEETEIE